MPAPSPLKAAAAAAGLTLTELAEELGYSPGTLGQVSRGHQQPWPELRRRLKDKLGRDPFEEDDLDRLRRVVAESRAEQGLPPAVVDEGVLRQAADLLQLGVAS